MNYQQDGARHCDFKSFGANRIWDEHFKPSQCEKLCKVSVILVGAFCVCIFLFLLGFLLFDDLFLLLGMIEWIKAFKVMPCSVLSQEN
jgi:hypothetical protein